MKENSTKSYRDVYFSLNIMEIEEMLLFMLKNIFNILKFRDYYALKSKTAVLIGLRIEAIQQIFYTSISSPSFREKPCLQSVLETYMQHRERKTKQ